MTKKEHLLTIYTRTPLHVGSGSSVDVVDLPVMRERITGFPVVPAPSLKGVLLQHARETFENGAHARSSTTKPNEACALFGNIEQTGKGDEERHTSHAGCVQIMEAKLLAFPVRSLAGCFAWLTCPSVLRRFQRDTRESFEIPEVKTDHVVHGAELKAGDHVVLEEYALKPEDGDLSGVIAALSSRCADPLWRALMPKRIALVHDDNFQHFVTTCTEIVTRIAIDPATRTVKDGHLFNQENIPCETLFYSVLTVLPSRRPGDEQFDGDAALAKLLPEASPPLLQLGGDETTGHGFCEVKREVLAK